MKQINLKLPENLLKAAQSYVEKIVTLAKKNKLSKNRVLASNLTGPAFLRLIREVAPGFADRNGGYTRIIKLNARKGDASQMARLEFLQWDKSEKKLATSPHPFKEKAGKAELTEKKTEKTEKRSVRSSKSSMSRVVARESKRQAPKKAQNKKGKK